MIYVLVKRTPVGWEYAGHYDSADEARLMLARLQHDYDLYEMGTCHPHVWEALCQMKVCESRSTLANSSALLETLTQHLS